MTEKYMLSEAWKKVKVGDRIVLMKKQAGGEEIEDYFIEILGINTNGEPCTYNSPFDPPSLRQSTSDQWQIIRAKKEMVSANESFKKEYDGQVLDESTYSSRAYKKAWDISAKNRDILYADLMEIIGKFLSELPEDLATPDIVAYRQLIRAEVLKIIDTIQPLTAATSSTG